MNRLLTVLVGCAAMAASGTLAQTYPTRPIKLIVPFAAGPTDTQYRKLAELAARELGQPIVVENKPGAGGTTGPVSMAKNDKPDGYTVSAAFGSLLRLPHMQKVDWDPIADFTWIIGLGRFAFVFSVRADSPFRTFPEALQWAKANPGKMAVGTPGAGTSQHLLLEVLGARTGTQFTHVGFKSGGESVQNLLGGHIMATNDVAGSVFTHAQAGRVRILMSFDEARPNWLAEVPTATELGYGLAYSSPYGLVGPRGMPPEIVSALHDAFKRAMDDPQNLALLESIKQVPWYRSSGDYEQWAREAFVVERGFVERAGLISK
jgi:tripartite-type tricarboxylate transporter receptor subunit TctC